MSRIYLSPPHLSGSELRLLEEALDSNWIAPLGPHVDAFEKELGQVVDVEHCLALSSGTAGLHLALEALGVGAGDRVFCPTLTFVATANAIRYCGAEPVFLDADPGSWNLDSELLGEELARDATRGEPAAAVISVDLYGQCADYGAIETMCSHYRVPLIEDAAEALGATAGNRAAGSFGRAAVFSFNGNKIITTSGGGMLLSHDETVITRARFLATQARDPAPHYEHSVIGYNYRLSNLLAAVGRAQLATLDDRVERRRTIFARYAELLGSLPGLEFMPEAQYGRPTRWLTCLTIDPSLFGADREAVRLALEAGDIEARPVWKPMHLQPLYRDCRCVGGSVAEDLFTRGLCLPSGSHLSDDDIERIASIVRDCRKT